MCLAASALALRSLPDTQRGSCPKCTLSLDRRRRPQLGGRSAEDHSLAGEVPKPANRLRSPRASPSPPSLTVLHPSSRAHHPAKTLSTHPPGSNPQTGSDGSHVPPLSSDARSGAKGLQHAGKTLSIRQRTDLTGLEPASSGSFVTPRRPVQSQRPRHLKVMGPGGRAAGRPVGSRSWACAEDQRFLRDRDRDVLPRSSSAALPRDLR